RDWPFSNRCRATRGRARCDESRSHATARAGGVQGSTSFYARRSPHKVRTDYRRSIHLPAAVCTSQPLGPRKRGGKSAESAPDTPPDHQECNISHLKKFVHSGTTFAISCNDRWMCAHCPNNPRLVAASAAPLARHTPASPA